MNTRSILSAALAAGVFFAPALSQAQSPTPPSLDQSRQAKIERLQAQVNALQAQVKRLKAQVRASSPFEVISPFDKAPKYNSGPFQIAPFQSPGIQDFGGQGFGGQGFGGQGRLPQVLVPRIYSNIPPCSITLIYQKTR